MMLVIVLMAMCLPLRAGEVKHGATAIVPNWSWVEVKNTTPIKNLNASYAFGDTCGIDRGGVIKVEAVTGDRLLVRYTAKVERGGSPCPSGTLYFVTTAAFSGMTAEYHKVIAAEAADKALINNLLKKK